MTMNVFSRPGVHRIALVALASTAALAGTLTLTAGLAQAEPPKLVLYGMFGSGAPGSPLPAHASEHSLGVAVDNSALASAGDVYVADFFNSAELPPINTFDASGNRIAPPFGSGFNGAAAVNPTNGDLYVLNPAAGSVETYDPQTGALATECIKVSPGAGSYTNSTCTTTGSGGEYEIVTTQPFSVPNARNFKFFPGFFLDFVQIAADSAGNVYVPETFKEKGAGEYEPGDEVLEYSPTGELLKTFTGGSGTGKLKEPTAVAIDLSGNLWVVDAGNNRIEELNPADSPSGRPIPIKNENAVGGSRLNSIALDGRGDVFVIVDNGDSCGPLAVEAPCSHLVEYEIATGKQVADVGAGAFESCSGKCTRSAPMVAANESNGRVYVTDGAKELVWIFGPPTPLLVLRETTAEVTTSEAKLGALVNPGGVATSYRFEYDTREYLEGEAPGEHGQSVEGSVGEGIAARAVWGAARGLAPGTTYHYRVVVTNALGRVIGPDHTFTTLTAAQATCSENEEMRTRFSASLPDCRAYELVTPPVKTSAEFDAGVNREGPGAPAGGGGALPLTGKEPFPTAESGGESYVSTRGTDGWILENINPLESYTGVLCNGLNDLAEAYSGDTSKAVLAIGANTSASGSGNKESCNAEGLEVVPGEPVGYQNLLVRDNRTRTYRLVNNLNAAPPGVRPAAASFQGASADLSHVVFSEAAPLTSNAAYGVEELYEWDEGAVRLVTVLPEGRPVVGSLAAAHGSAANEQVISAEGSHVLFTSEGSLYDRVDGERTVQVDKALPGAGSSGGGVFQGASADGSQVFFTDENRLTAGSTAAANERDLYECRIVEVEGNLKCDLTDLTVAKKGEHANVQKVSPLGAKDSSHVYFTATGALAEGAKSDENNLYMWEAPSSESPQARTVFIAALAPGEPGVGPVSPDGTWFAFNSTKSLTGYDNAEIGTGGLQEEIFLYGAATGQLECASCKPSGEAPTPGASVISHSLLPSSERRPLSDGGRLFFESQEALAPSDTNGQLDVYEYENGQPSLISSGTSEAESAFLGASESGDDVFFGSNQQLVPQDTQPGLRVVYDARVNGGFPPNTSPPECTTPEGCRGAASAQAALYGAPASQTFSGVGNLAPQATAKPKPKPLKCKRGFVRKRVKAKKKPRSRRNPKNRYRCVRKPRHKAKSHRKGGRS